MCGALTPQSYAAMLKEVMDKDVAICKYLKPIKSQDGVSEKIDLCVKRFKMVKIEYEELSKNL